MKTFSQHLQTIAEGRDAPLYHGVRIADNCVNILLSRHIEPRTAHPIQVAEPNSIGVVIGVSLTRSYKFAVTWSSKFQGMGMVVELDQHKLTTRFKIRPINYWNTSARKVVDTSPGYAIEFGSEFEEFIETKQPISIEKYATRIYANKQIFDQLFLRVVGRNPVDITECMSFCNKYLGVPVGPIK
jgi:hypothetical protein